MSDKTNGYLNTKQAAALTGYTKDYIGQLAREGHIQSKKDGRSRLVLISDLFAYVQSKNTDPSLIELTPQPTPGTRQTDIVAAKSVAKERSVVTKKIVSPWVADSDPLKDMPKPLSSSATPEFSEKSYVNPRPTKQVVSYYRDDVLPMISTTAVVLAGLVLMFTIGTMVYDQSQLASADHYQQFGVLNTAAAGQQGILDKFASGWYQMVSNTLK